MSSRCLVTVTIALLGCILAMLSPTPAAYGPLNHACCVRYTKKPVAFRLIKGIVEQSSLEVCNMDAIIFYTINNKRVCASTQDKWVRVTLEHFSSKLKKMSGVTKPGKNIAPPSWLTNSTTAFSNRFNTTDNHTIH